jgi:hypothetical protein
MITLKTAPTAASLTTAALKEEYGCRLVKWQVHKARLRTASGDEEYG